MTRGIFLSFNSFKAISKGSVSLSTGTRTGAFILDVSDDDRPLRHHGCPTDLIWSALVPKTRARSYFVMYGVVTRTSFALAAFPVLCRPSSCGTPDS
jgi:hypothetical protein